MLSVLYALWSGFPAYAQESSAQDKPFWSPDRQQHAVYSAAIAATTYVYARKYQLTKWEAFAMSFGTTMFIGFAKEAFDPKIDTEDLKADAIGTAAGGGVLFLVDVIVF
jgi:hypothetical protein